MQRCADRLVGVLSPVNHKGLYQGRWRSQSTQIQQPVYAYKSRNVQTGDVDLHRNRCRDVQTLDANQYNTSREMCRVKTTIYTNTRLQIAAQTEDANPCPSRYNKCRHDSRRQSMQTIQLERWLKTPIRGEITGGPNLYRYKRRVMQTKDKWYRHDCRSVQTQYDNRQLIQT